MKPTIFLDPAETEMLEAARFYESNAEGLGLEFLSEVQKALHDISSNPVAYPIIEKEIRRRHVYRFPYGVLYREDPDQIVIIAVMHLHRRPGYWSNR